MKNVMIVDDDRIFNFIITQTLNLHDILHVDHVFYDGESALDFLQRNINDDEALPDVLFIDLVMPRLNGKEMIEELALLLPRMNKHIDIFVSSCSLAEEDIKWAKNLAFVNDYIIKPFTPDIIHWLEDKYSFTNALTA